VSPQLVIADWRARVLEGRRREYGRQRASSAVWVHKTANVLAKFAEEPAAEGQARALQEIWMAETKAAAELALVEGAQKKLAPSRRSQPVAKTRSRC